MGLLIRNVLAMVREDNRFTTKTTSIWVEGDRIVSMDKEPEGFKAETVIDGTGRMAIPGFINAHTHSYMTLFRNCADDLPFSDWLFKHISPLEDKMTDEDAYNGAKLAMIEMVKSGTTCFLDMHMNVNRTTQAALETGVRGVITRGLADGEKGRLRIDQALAEIREYKDEPLLSFMLGPHAPYSCDTDYLKQVIRLSEDMGLGINIHLSESLFEVNEMKKKCGLTPIEQMEKIGLFARPVVAAHCVQLTGSDMRILRDNNVSVATCPASNMKLGNGFSPVPELDERGINVCIGTDGAGSNNSLNIIQEMRFVTMIHSGYRKDPVIVGAQDALRFATVNGAKALGYEGRLGELKEGYLADIAILNLDTPTMAPRNNPVSALCYSANGSEFETVIINGRIVMKDRHMVNVDEEEVIAKANESARRLVGWSGDR